jgi:hypothetical protein
LSFPKDNSLQAFQWLENALMLLTENRLNAW